MNLSQALVAMEQGKLITRDWDVIVFKQNGYPHGIPLNPNTAQATGLKVGQVCRFKPYLQSYNKANESFVHYTLSQEDVFATDWQVVDEIDE